MSIVFFKRRLLKYWILIYYYNISLILPIKRKAKGRISNLLLLILSPYILLNYLFSVLYENIYAIKAVERRIIKEKNSIFEHEIAIVSISKNEGPYIQEWIEYHKLVGVTKFYFYDNESADETLAILKPYIEDGLVEYTLLKGKSQQLVAYNDAISKHKNEVRYMAFIDMDEYIMPDTSFKPLGEGVKEVVSKYKGGVAGIGVNWAIFGSAGLEKMPSGLIMENFVRRGLPTHWINYHIKTICNPRLVKRYISPHFPQYKLGAYSVSVDGVRLYAWYCHDVTYHYLRINHYFTKSKEQYLQKRSRGLGDRIGKYELDKFNVYNLNDVFDDSMKVYTLRIKEQIEKNNL